MDSASVDDLPLFIETSPPIANLLMRAEEGIERRDWKLAIDSLQRVIDDRSGTMVAAEGPSGADQVLFESARRRAIRRLASMPGEGLLAYRVLNDGRAKGLFDRAQAANDQGGMEAVADRFLLTRYGDQATDWVASRAFDEGRFGVAISRLQELLAFVPDHDIPPAKIYSKLYAAYRILGFDKDAELVLEDLRKAGPESVSQADLLAASFADRWVEGTRLRMAEASLHQDWLPRSIGPPLTPSLAGPVPWIYELTGTSADLWRRIADFQPGDPPPIPRIELTGNGQQLFVRIPGGCVALDMEDLMLVWKSVSGAVPRPQVEDVRRGISPQSTVRVTGPYHDDSLNRIHVAHGMVFTIDINGIGEYLDRDEVQAGGLFFLRGSPRTLRQVSGTMLTALDAQTGDVRWRRGRTDDSGDILGSVRFLSTPIAVGDQLWVPYMRGSDLYVAGLRPADGAVMRLALIASVRESPNPRETMRPRETVTPLTLAEDLVLVPTGLGGVAALDVRTMRLAWLHVFGGPRRPADISSRWIASPPLAHGGVVIHTGVDHENVLGLDAASGGMLWTFDVQGGAYAIAADRGMAWLGGRTVTAIDIVSGEPVWTFEVAGTPTGKAALCGGQIHIPSSQGLTTLDAATGNVVATVELPSTQAPLGNLACVGTSLYSIEPSSIRKFPDLERMQASAHRELELRPGDAGSTVRLAWSLLLQGQARTAFDAASRVPHTDALPLRTRSNLARIRIESLLAVAEQVESPQESLELLRAASLDDLTASLRLRFQTAMVEQLIALGRLEEAYETLTQLALSEDASELGQSVDGVRVSARVALRDKIEELRVKIDMVVLERLDRRGRAQVDALLREGGEGQKPALLAASQVYRRTEIAHHALMGLSDLYIEALEYEQAEQTLLEILRQDATHHTDAWRKLVRLYLDSDQSAPGLIWSGIKDWELRHGQNSTADRNAPWLEAEPELEARLGHRLSNERTNLALKALYAEPGMESASMSLTSVDGWAFEPPGEAEPARILQFESRLPPVLADRVIMVGRDGYLVCLGLESKEILWQTKLEMPGDFHEGPDTGGRSQTIARYGVADGQTVIVNGPEGIFAVGALTGRLLWARPFDRAVMDLAGAAARDRLMAAYEGMLVAAPRDGYLSMMRVADGSIVWERDLRGESLGRLWATEGRVVMVDTAQKRIHLFRISDGKLLARILVRQPAPEHERISLLVSEGHVLAPDRGESDEGVVAYDLQTGQQTWRTSLDKPVVSIFRPGPGYVGVGLLGGDVKVFRIRDGEVVLERSDPSVRAVTSGSMWAGTLVLRSTALHGPRQSIELAAFDIATGAEIWRRKDLSALSTGPERLEIINGVIPAVIEKSRDETEGKQRGSARVWAMAALIDVRTGADAGTAVDIIGAQQGVSITGDMVLWPGMLAVGSMKSVQAMRVDLSPLPERGF